MTQQLYIGMISGTSRDGVDAALVNFKGGLPAVVEAICAPHPSALAESLDRLVRTGRRPEEAELEALDRPLCAHFSHSVTLLLDRASVRPEQVTAVGSHGQTVWHDPDGPKPESIQLGDPRRIARQTGIVTVGDFRRADIEAGGQGAPLAPLLHQALFSARKGKRIVVNLGGIANISVINPSGAVSGFDTGPANCLLDAWAKQHLGVAFDRNGEWGAGGRVIPGLLKDMLADPYFRRAAPKSTGIEYFNPGWLERFLEDSPPEPRDVQATLAELTARSVTDSIRPHRPGDIVVCGGGAHNADLLRRMRTHLPDLPVRSSANLGLDPDWIEAVLFAWLARERLAERPLDTQRITGARSPVLLGTVARPG